MKLPWSSTQKRPELRARNHAQTQNKHSPKPPLQELATRLEQASRQLDGALYDARRNVEAKEGMTLAANREKEIASRLKDRARATLEEWQENKLAALPRYRRMQRNEGQ